MSLKERLAKKSAPESVLTILDERFLVVGLSRTERAELFEKCTLKDGKRDFKRLEGVALSTCVKDPDSRQSVYTVEEWQKWDNLPSAFTGPLVAEVMRLNGMDDADVGREVKNSGSADS